jgi:hypothetical protein
MYECRRLPSISTCIWPVFEDSVRNLESWFRRIRLNRLRAISNSIRPSARNYANASRIPSDQRIGFKAAMANPTRAAWQPWSKR